MKIDEIYFAVVLTENKMRPQLKDLVMFNWDGPILEKEHSQATKELKRINKMDGCKYEVQKVKLIKIP